MISEASWSNDAENSALITAINYILQIYIFKKKTVLVILFHNITVFCCIFDQIN